MNPVTESHIPIPKTSSSLEYKGNDLARWSNLHSQQRLNTHISMFRAHFFVPCTFTGYFHLPDMPGHTEKVISRHENAQQPN